jgi:hypothetical protein
VGTGEYFSGSKAAGAWSWPLTLYCRSQEWWHYTSIHQYVFMAWWCIN